MTLAGGGAVRHRPPGNGALRSETADAYSLLAPSVLLVLLCLILPLCLMARYSLNRYSPGDMMVAALTLELSLIHI